MTEEFSNRVRQTVRPPNKDFTPDINNETLLLLEDLRILFSNFLLNHYGEGIRLIVQQLI